MGMLSDTDIRTILSISSNDLGLPATGRWVEPETHILIHPFIEKSLSPVGYDLSIGNKLLSFARKDTIELSKDRAFEIYPKETVLIMTKEYIGLPKDQTIAGLIESKVSMASKGLSHISTTVDNDWEGHLLISITNHQPYTIKLHEGDTFCTILFFKTDTKATKLANKPAGRPDVIQGQMNDWLKEIKRKRIIKAIIPTLVMLFVVVGATLAFMQLIGPKDGFAEAVALGAALAAVIQPTVQAILSEYIKR
jgi:deoxycytidine triphosphate deaminase